MKALFDSNILIDYLNGIEAAQTEFNHYKNHAISIITWMEVMTGSNVENAAITRGFLAGFEIIQITEAIAAKAVELRRERRMKLPDAVILATARENNLLLVTRNVKDFDASLPGVRVPYNV
jgi:predicted nucleic acid-binding protein